ncbi:membrane-bound acid phosphatase 1 precursor [Corchorus olitorius]|uniref:Membrane-bound acid phosphatase 1 n=1 Tax=Corchorus olitorius TaxID=93759 RepID=A0A1R3L3D3_9ROSI|nr:membrane-bound acid phosphatase 1 precursor [Corchorus olitorius]
MLESGGSDNSQNISSLSTPSTATSSGIRRPEWRQASTFFKPLRTLAGPDNVLKAVKSKISETLPEKVVSSHGSRFPVSPGNIRNLCKAFLEILSDGRNAGLHYLMDTGIFVQLTNNAISFPFFGPGQYTFHP